MRVRDECERLIATFVALHFETFSFRKKWCCIQRAILALSFCNDFLPWITLQVLVEISIWFTLSPAIQNNLTATRAPARDRYRGTTPTKPGALGVKPIF